MIEVPKSSLGSPTNLLVTTPESEYGYLPIPKNASGYAYDFFSQFDWKYYQYDNYDEVKNKKKIVLFREPFERWCSGVAQDVFFQKLKLDPEGPDALFKLFLEPRIGIHTYPQSHYLSHIDPSKLIFIRVDNNLIKNMEALVKNVMKTKLLQHFPTPYKSTTYYRIKNKVSEALKANPIFQQKLKMYLAEDIRIYKSTKFYTGQKKVDYL